MARPINPHVQRGRKLADDLGRGHFAMAEAISMIRELADQLEIACRRKPPTRKVPATSTHMTASLAQDIRAYAVRHPLMSQAQIGHVFAVNPGRVSEALTRRV